MGLGLYIMIELMVIVTHVAVDCKWKPPNISFIDTDCHYAVLLQLF